jgi:hypothetical protein
MPSLVHESTVLDGVNGGGRRHQDCPHVLVGLKPRRFASTPMGLTGLTPTARVRFRLLRRPPLKTSREYGTRCLRELASHVSGCEEHSSNHLLSVWHECQHLLLHTSCDVGDCKGASLSLRSQARNRSAGVSRATRTSSGQGSRNLAVLVAPASCATTNSRPITNAISSPASDGISQPVPVRRHEAMRAISRWRNGGEGEHCAHNGSDSCRTARRQGWIFGQLAVQFAGFEVWHLSNEARGMTIETPKTVPLRDGSCCRHSESLGSGSRRFATVPQTHALLIARFADVSRLSRRSRASAGPVSTYATTEVATGLASDTNWRTMSQPASLT